MSSHRLCIAPMMDRTDRHFRYLLRLLAPHARLYRDDHRAALSWRRARLLEFDAAEHPSLCGSGQRAGGSPSQRSADAGYDEISGRQLPSDRVRRAASTRRWSHPVVADFVAPWRAVAVPSRSRRGSASTTTRTSSSAARHARARRLRHVMSTRASLAQGKRARRECGPPLDHSRHRQPTSRGSVVINGGLRRPPVRRAVGARRRRDARPGGRGRPRAVASSTR
jgi:hypothetical protein